MNRGTGVTNRVVECFHGTSPMVGSPTSARSVSTSSAMTWWVRSGRPIELMPTETCRTPASSAAIWPANSATSLTTRSGWNSSIAARVSASAARARSRANSPAIT